MVGSCGSSFEAGPGPMPMFCMPICGCTTVGGTRLWSICTNTSRLVQNCALRRNCRAWRWKGSVKRDRNSLALCNSTRWMEIYALPETLMVPKMVCSMQRWIAAKNRKKNGMLKGRIAERSKKRVEHPAGMPQQSRPHQHGCGRPRLSIRRAAALVFCVRCVKSDRATARPKSASKPVDRGKPGLVMEWTCDME